MLEIRRNEWMEMVSGILAIINKFPEHEFSVRKLCSRDSDFMGLCNDYEDAAIALRHWEGAGIEYTTRTDEYRQLLGELEIEILSSLELWRRQRLPHDN